ncbi:MAG: thiamine-phosphate kinase [Deltaproteobacteria bacterium]|nr:thiamine-phosphate kinase [Deltaproteobacteria bacterium]
MLTDNLKEALRFNFITDDNAPALTPVEQVTIALKAGSTIIQYRNKSITPHFFEEIITIKNMCKTNHVPFLINDDIILAKAVQADGVHLGQSDESSDIARKILGPEAIIGISVSTLDELSKTDLSPCDYIGTGPVFPTDTKEDASSVIKLSGLKALIEKVSLPVVAIGGISEDNARSCMENGAAGVAVISAVSRSKDPLTSASGIALACGCQGRTFLESHWTDEFALIDKLLAPAREHYAKNDCIKIPPGDDTSLFRTIKNPVITTDTQREGVHFYFDWQTPEEVGSKAIETTLSDLAASYAEPVSVFVNLALPSDVSEKTIEALYKGIHKTLNKHQCSLGGGNISKSNQLSLDLFAVGNGIDKLFPARSGAQSGDGLYCTGPIGLARAGLYSLQKRDLGFIKLIEKFKSPAARFDASRVLAENGVKCVIDISDGLSGDAHHIAKASGISIEFNLNTTDFDPDLVLFCKKYNLEPQNLILAGGEDYELLFTCQPSVFEKIKKDLPSVIQVGHCLPFNKTHLLNLPSDVSSFQHGK